MDMALLGVIKWYWQVLAVVFTIMSILLVIIVLLQKGRGGGLSAAFGGAGGQSAFGSKTGDYFTWVTVGVVGFFLITAMVLTMHYRPTTELGISRGSSLGSPPGVEPTPAPLETKTNEKQPAAAEATPEKPAGETTSPLPTIPTAETPK
ncbi:MAG: preprotein translocase subunit SecG [Sedimentisphaerales bacterium]|nr:preprotein translocase subunit SecG [Sedimentisphaerales bacterium]